MTPKELIELIDKLVTITLMFLIVGSLIFDRGRSK